MPCYTGEGKCRKASELSTGPQNAQIIKLSMTEWYSSINKPHWMCLLGYWRTSWVIEGTRPLTCYLKVQLKQASVSPVVAHCSIATCLWYLLCKYVPMDMRNISSFAKRTQESPKRSDTWHCTPWYFLEVSSAKAEFILVLKLLKDKLWILMCMHMLCEIQGSFNGTCRSETTVFNHFSLNGWDRN